MRLDGLKVLVTGGSRGLGAATAELFAKSSCKVAIWDADKDEGIQNATSLGATFYQTDVGCTDSVRASWAQLVSDFTRVDVVVNCAGIALVTPVLGVPVEEIMKAFDNVMKVNLYGTYLVSALAGQQMATQTEVDGERGCIVNVSSISAEFGDFISSAYSSSKGAISGMTLPLARDFATHKIRINAIAPGFFETRMTGDFPPPLKAFIKSQSTTLSYGQPEDFAHLVKSIVENRYISGTIIPIDSGLVPPNLKTLGPPPS
mmetsp:Transcript_33971/g.59195  ORF Transcript_33971/g.59195 Transcript_33971/m.59195 type:complete len:260 (+) Transcript_33971:74-853(+)